MIDRNSSDEEILKFLAQVRTEASCTEALAADLAVALADSGERFRADGGPTADVASTGGPTSLSTLLCPLVLRAAGHTVVKLGIPGRPAGGIDCLAQIPGYRVNLSKDELLQVLSQCGYAHFLSASRFAPLDARVFALRQRIGAQAVPTLVAASLLAKKLAVGVGRVGLDVRVAPHGNFGQTWADARRNAHMFVATANRLGVVATAILTDGVQPYQPFIGRKEALVALWFLFESMAPAWLQEHWELCWTLAAASLPYSALPAAEKANATGYGREHFEGNLIAQGTSYAHFRSTAEATLAAHNRVIKARRDGFVVYQLEAIRSAFVQAQTQLRTSAFSDPIGLILQRRPGEYVSAGDSIATLRHDMEVDVAVLQLVEDSLSETSTVAFGSGFEVVNG